MEINDNDKLLVTESINNIIKIILLSSIYLKLRVCVCGVYNLSVYGGVQLDKRKIPKQLYLHCKMCENTAECNENNKI